MEVEIGRITHYYNHLNVAVLNLNDVLKLGDKIRIRGHATNLVERVASMEVDRRMAIWAKPGDDVTIKVNGPVHTHDVVYRIVEEIPEPQLA